MNYKSKLSKNSISVDSVASMGDGTNDYEMINYTGYGVAMKNSHQSVKDVANIYIDVNSEDGAVGTFIKEYILGEKNEK